MQTVNAGTRRTGAALVRHALEQLPVSHTFGIPGVHNTELYDQLGASDGITPVLWLDGNAIRAASQDANLRYNNGRVLLTALCFVAGFSTVFVARSFTSSVLVEVL